MSNFANNLKKWRMAQHLTQTELAQKAEIARPNLIAIENGERSCTLDTLNNLAEALSISPGTLLDQSPHPSIVLDRYELDTLCRALLGQLKSKSRTINQLVDLLTPIIYPICRTIGYKPKIKLRNKPWVLKQQASILLGTERVKQVIERCNKLASNL